MNASSAHLRQATRLAIASALLGALLYACSGDDSGASGSDGSAGSAGSGGSGGSGDPMGRGGSAGEGASGGTANEVGGSGGSGGGGSGAGASGGSAGERGEAGAAGQAGMEQMPDPAGATCLACAEEDDCFEALSECEGESDCRDWADCVSACEDDACSASCDSEFAAARHLFAPLYACLADACSSVCEPLDPGSYDCEDTLAPSETAPANLAETGLYVDDGQGGFEIAPYMRGYEPKFELWSDGAKKQRYIYIPECQRIASDDMDNWDFPVGTRVFKTFSSEPTEGGDPIQVETRMLHRFGPDPDDWLMVTYQWDATSEETLHNPELALLVPSEGVVDANGTHHDIPSTAACENCHAKLSSKVLGFSAIQLSHDGGGETMKSLSDEERLTVPAAQGFPVPGTAEEQAALGMLHANCGQCHNHTFNVYSPPLKMKLLVDQTTVEETDVFTTAVGVAAQNAAYLGQKRIEPGSSSTSVLWQRPNKLEMPPGNAANELPNDAGLEALAAWIDAMPAAE